MISSTKRVRIKDIFGYTQTQNIFTYTSRVGLSTTLFVWIVVLWFSVSSFIRYANDPPVVVVKSTRSMTDADRELPFVLPQVSLSLSYYLPNGTEVHLGASGNGVARDRYFECYFQARK